MRLIKTDPALRQSSRLFITNEVMRLANSLPPIFYTMKRPDRMAVIERETSAGLLRRFAQQMFSSGSYASHATALHGAAKRLGRCPLVIVQTADELVAEPRKKLHMDLSNQYPEAFIRFETCPDLAGGMRIFADGVVIDASWRGRLRSILSRVELQS